MSSLSGSGWSSGSGGFGNPWSEGPGSRLLVLINISLEVKLNCYKEEFLLPVDR